MSTSINPRKIKQLPFDEFFHYLIIIYAFLLPITIAGIVLFEHLIIIFFIIGCSKGKISVQFKDLKNSRIIIILALFLLLSLLSVIWSDDKTFALLYIKKYYHFLLAPIIYLSFNKKYIKPVFFSFLLGMFLSQLLSYLMFFEIIQYNNIPSHNPTPFMDRINYSVYLSFTAMILLIKSIFPYQNKYRIFYFILFLSTVSVLFINGGRTGQIAFIISLFVIVFLNIKNKVKAVIVASLLLIGILATAYNTSPTFKSRSNIAVDDINQTLSKKDYSQSFGTRISLLIIGANIFKENFFLGTGIGNEKKGLEKYAEKYNVNQYRNLSDKGDFDYHNLYMQHGVQLGILGLLLMLALVYSLFKIKFKSNLYQNINIAFSISILVFSVAFNILHALFPVVFFVFFTSILSAISKSEVNENIETKK